MFLFLDSFKLFSRSNYAWVPFALSKICEKKKGLSKSFSFPGLTLKRAKVYSVMK